MDRYPTRIIVEGMDGSGKTMLINHLQTKFPDLFVIKNELGPDQDFNFWWPEILDQEAVKERSPIHDRFFYSELIYGPILRGTLAAEPEVINNVLWFLRQTSMLIYSRPNTDWLRKGFSNKPQMEGVEEKFIQLLELYDHTMETEKNWYGSRFIHYVWHRENEFERVAEIIKEYLKDALR